MIHCRFCLSVSSFKFYWKYLPSEYSRQKNSFFFWNLLCRGGLCKLAIDRELRQLWQTAPRLPGLISRSATFSKTYVMCVANRCWLCAHHGCRTTAVHSEIFSQTLFDFKKSISGPIELKFSGKTLYAILLPRTSSLVGLFLKITGEFRLFSPFPWKCSIYNSFFTNFVWL